ncbi:MAG: UvrB/UvrC motif-containing protein, partial [Flavobacteriales bacterium]
VKSDPIWERMSVEELTKSVEHTKRLMERAAKDLDFMEAARLRDEYFGLKELLETKESKA